MTPKPRPVDGDERCVCQREKKLNWMLKQVEHDNRVLLLCFVIPNLIRDLHFWFRAFGF